MALLSLYATIPEHTALLHLVQTLRHVLVHQNQDKGCVISSPHNALYLASDLIDLNQNYSVLALSSSPYVELYTVSLRRLRSLPLCGPGEEVIGLHVIRHNCTTVIRDMFRQDAPPIVCILLYKGRDLIYYPNLWNWAGEGGRWYSMDGFTFILPTGKYPIFCTRISVVEQQGCVVRSWSVRNCPMIVCYLKIINLKFVHDTQKAFFNKLCFEGQRYGCHCGLMPTPATHLLLFVARLSEEGHNNLAHYNPRAINMPQMRVAVSSQLIPHDNALSLKPLEDRAQWKDLLKFRGELINCLLDTVGPVNIKIWRQNDCPVIDVAVCRLHRCIQLADIWNSRLGQPHLTDELICSGSAFITPLQQMYSMTV